MSNIAEIVSDIIELGRSNDWFIDFLQGLGAADYIYAKGSVIYIDTTSIQAFLDENKTSTDEELEDYLREMIEANIPESKKFQIKVLIKNEDNYLDGN